jgi:hypothetical protein
LNDLSKPKITQTFNSNIRRRSAMLSKHRLSIPAISFLSIGYAIATMQSIRAEDKIATVSSIKKAPYSKVFYTGSIYAVRDRDYKLSEPKIGVSTLWSENTANGNLSLGVRYCVPDNALTGSLAKLALLDKHRSLVTIDHPIKATPIYQKAVRNVAAVPDFGFWGPGTYWGNDGFWDDFNDPFWSGIDNPAWSYNAPRPAITCNAGSSRFDIAPLTNDIARLPTQTLQMNLIFSNGSASQWKLRKKTVQALKALLAIRQTLPNSVQTPSAK